jgi:hypothetical protein
LAHENFRATLDRIRADREGIHEKAVFDRLKINPASEKYKIDNEATPESTDILDLLKLSPKKPVPEPDQVTCPQDAEKAFDIASVAIAFTSSLDAGIFKTVDNTFKERRSFLAKMIRAGAKFIKWHLIPGSFVIDMALLITKEAHPPKKVKETSPYLTKIKTPPRMKNREAFQDFLTAQGLSLINKLV